MKPPSSHSRVRKYLIASALGLGATGALIMAVALPTTGAHAIVVFDPSNYSQNVLTAARTLQQINNQIRSLQNQAQSLINQAKNLATIGFPELEAITQTLRQIDQLMGQAQGIQFRVANLDQALTSNQRVVAAKARLDTAMAAYKQTMGVQSQVVENVQADTQTLRGIVARSQGAEGSLQAQQATNQLLALTAKQQFQIQTLMASQYRAQAIEQARRVQGEAEARAATTKFLGSGSAYSPQ
ncbi:P-type conjugative transfer protein TrbJ [Sphingomonas sp. OK281]|uniref:P-type conjugative transfer protein TrbJ n=1 Tax=Sphingomonas sp. OK281 TaxID=1881067 RepID=UPI0008F2CB37|nr:P-type conjugative transfer protein TrbJ [Sphingomonas sp. OK281]SFN66742.1 P-type conjugative transfer protein TrbJ [Sphingomonas sp. OK281]